MKLTWNKNKGNKKRSLPQFPNLPFDQQDRGHELTDTELKKNDDNNEHQEPHTKQLALSFEAQGNNLAEVPFSLLSLQYSNLLFLLKTNNFSFLLLSGVVKYAAYRICWLGSINSVRQQGKDCFWGEIIRLKNCMCASVVSIQCLHLRLHGFHYYDGTFILKDGKFREALGKWETALNLRPENAVLHEQKAQVLLELGDAWNALKAATRMIKFIFLSLSCIVFE